MSKYPYTESVYQFPHSGTWRVCWSTAGDVSAYDFRWGWVRKLVAADLAGVEYVRNRNELSEALRRARLHRYERP